MMRLRVGRPPAETEVRRPSQYALLEGPPLSSFHLEVDVQRDGSKEKTAIIFVHAWKSPARFNYIHLCDEPATQQPRHNGIFHVLDGERVRISPVQGPGSLPTGGWNHIDARWDGASGRVQTRVDGRAHLSLQVVDLSLTRGRIGLGSFFQTGAFCGFRLQSA